MFRLNQIIRNLFIRLEAFVSVILRNFLGFFSQFFGLLGKLLGFSKSEYFLEPDQVQDKKSTKTLELTPTLPQPNVTSTTRRSNAKMDDYFLNMAKQVKK
ncbi:MAG: threonine dehydratase [Stigonema ocellatum SAG 48.90 = DSM 106950]|nr:threonine dehydratase [Stigonema ocellatum SAG 48.90 = DSM 106950]